jgi:hypothetical protein
VEPGEHLDVLLEAIQADGEGFRLLLEGDRRGARAALTEAAGRYRRSWEVAPPRSYGRLVGMLKSAVIGGEGPGAAAYARAALEGGCDSPTSCYALAIAALAEGDDATAARAAEGMSAGDPPFRRAADAIAALAAGDGAAYAAALEAIVADFAARDAHLTGVPIADTAVMLEMLAVPRGLARRPDSPLVPAVSDRG